MKKTTKDLIKFDFDIAVISALDERYKDIQTAEGTKPYALIMKGLSEYCAIRTAIDAQYIKLNAAILEAGRSLRGDKTRLKELIQPGESRLRDLKNAEDDRKDAIKEEKAEKERERIEGIQEKINSVRALGIVHGKTSSDIQDRLTLIRGIEITEEVYEGFTNQAIQYQMIAIATLETSLADRLQFEKEEVDRSVEARRLEIQRKEQEAAQAKIDERNKTFDDSRAWFKKYIKGDSFQTPTINDAENAIIELQSAIDIEEILAKRFGARMAKDIPLKMLLKEQVEEAHGILAFRKDQAKLEAAQAKIDEGNRKVREGIAKLEAGVKADKEHKDREEFERQAEIKAHKEATEKADREACERIEKEAAEAMEKARQEALKPDREKLISFANELLDIPNMRSLSTKKAQEIAGWAIAELSKLSGTIKAKANKL